MQLPAHIPQSDDRYPAALTLSLPEDAPTSLTAIGDLGILDKPKLALFCSRRCPGSIILDTYDYISSLKDGKWAVIGGFHSPMERECLAILLRHKQPAILCPARGIENMRVPKELRPALEEGRLLILSGFKPSLKRTTVETAQLRNRIVGALADRVLVPHAAVSSRTEALCRELLDWGKPVFTFPVESNANLLAIGSQQDSEGRQNLGIVRLSIAQPGEPTGMPACEPERHGGESPGSVV